VRPLLAMAGVRVGALIGLATGEGSARDSCLPRHVGGWYGVVWMVWGWMGWASCC
jgi:hypothetical protein